jgi:hypothetical protein
MPPLYNAYEAKLLNVLHSKLCKEEKEKENDLIILGDLPLLKKDGLFSGATSPHTHTVYFHGRPALKLTLVYFHGRPTHTCSSWSIFTGDLPINVHPGLSSWATCPSTHTDLFSRATYPHMLILVYFQG